MRDVRVGIHLPQAGPAAGPQAIREAAQLAERLGYEDVWVSDHLVVPMGIEYPPSPYVFEPLVTLTWAAAATTRVRLGTTVLVLPMRNPLHVAKALASLDQLSEGRVTLGAAAGWLEAEFDALGVPFSERGRRTDEAIEVLRRMWTDDPITERFPVHGLEFESIRSKPQPVGRLPIWIGGHSPAAIDRAIRVGDGWHGAFRPPEKIGESIARLRSARPEAGFVISMRLAWDGLLDEGERILDELGPYREVGETHFVPEPRQRERTAYLESIEATASLLARGGVELAAGL